MIGRGFTGLILSVFGVAVSAIGAHAEDPVRIGAVTAMSGQYRDLAGPGFITAIQMAIDDFGGKVLHRDIELLSADDQLKADIASVTVREWISEKKIDAVFEGSNSASALAIQGIARENKTTAILFSGVGSLHNANCSPYGIQYVWDTNSLANGTASAIMKNAGDSWFFVTVDYAFGPEMQAAATATIEDLGGKVVGSLKHPLNTTDFASFMLTAQQSGAKVIALANAGQDTQNAVRQAKEFGVTSSVAPLLLFDTDVKGMGLELAQGLTFTTGYYWDFDEKTREFGNKFFQRHGAMPTMVQAGAYSATLHYLKAIESAGTTKPEEVIATMKKTPVDDFFARGGQIREDGRMVYDLYLVEVKKPGESTGQNDILKVLSTIPSDEAFAPLTQSKCPLVVNK